MCLAWESIKKHKISKWEFLCSNTARELRWWEKICVSKALFTYKCDNTTNNNHVKNRMNFKSFFFSLPILPRFGSFISRILPFKQYTQLNLNRQKVLNSLELKSSRNTHCKNGKNKMGNKIHSFFISRVHTMIFLVFFTTAVFNKRQSVKSLLRE